MIVSRRHVLVAGLGGLVSCVMPVGAGGRAWAQPADIRFRVLRGGSTIGNHTVSFQGPANRLTTQTDIQLQVRVAFVTAFRFSHRSTEEWRDGRLASIRSRTDDNGQVYEVSGSPVADGFRVVGPGGPFVAPGDLLTSNSVWNSAFVKQSLLINAQQGGELGLSARAIGSEAPSGAPSDVAMKYRVVTPHLAGYVWYDRNGQWVRATFEIEGEVLDYVPA